MSGIGGQSWIIACEKCRSKFNLDESLLSQKGSKVRCSLCKHVFTAYLQEPSRPQPEPSDRVLEDLEETVALHSPPYYPGGASAPRFRGSGGT